MGVTAFVGAGAAIDLGGPSTARVTEVISQIPTVFGGHPLRIFGKIADTLNKYYTEKQCNFEEVFFVLELLETYLHAKQPEIQERFKTPIAPYIDIESSIIELFNEYPTNTPIPVNYTVYLSQAKDNLRAIVGNMINEYNSKTREDWFINFWNKELSHSRHDIATLNYDTSIEDAGIYLEDGFESTVFPFKKFNPKLLDGANSTILHLHGSIKYGYGKYDDSTQQYLENHREDLFKYDSFLDAQQHWDIRIEQTAQSGEQTIIGPIITGLRKTDKLIAYPYSYYNYWLTRSISMNKNLLIIGYSFGDLHFNSTLERILNFHPDARIVVIDYRNFNNKIKTEFTNLIFNSYNILQFFSKILKEYPPDKIIEKFDIERGHPAISNDGNTRIYFDGFKNTVINHGDEISNFLNG